MIYRLVLNVLGDSYSILGDSWSALWSALSLHASTGADGADAPPRLEPGARRERWGTGGSTGGSRFACAEEFWDLDESNLSSGYRSCFSSIRRYLGRHYSDWCVFGRGILHSNMFFSFPRPTSWKSMFRPWWIMKSLLRHGLSWRQPFQSCTTPKDGTEAPQAP